MLIRFSFFFVCFQVSGTIDTNCIIQHLRIIEQTGKLFIVTNHMIPIGTAFARIQYAPLFVL